VSNYPRIFRVRQHFTTPQLADVAGEVQRELAQLPLAARVKPGQTVAVTAGSRGVANIAVILKAAIAHLKSLGLQPFIVPAMGSHGGGTVEGQLEIIHGYGITEEFCGCPIRASMETVVVCQTKEGFPVHFDKHAFSADHVLVVGRVKPHTGFVGDIESGLMKMMLIGLGKHAGALVYHRAIMDYSFPQIVRSVAGEVMQKCRVLAGIGVVENEREETAKIAAVLPEELEAREKELLVLAKKWIPRLPFERAHILLIDQIGKNISGTGMDTNVVGRKFNDHKAVDDEWPKVKSIVIRSLTEETHGNATGLGMAEFCRTRVVAQTDVRKTRINCLTGGHVPAAMFPLDYESDRDILDVALTQIGLAEPPNAKLMWIHNTLDVVELECSEAYLPQAKELPNVEILCEPRALPFDAGGNLPDSVKSWK
jgi:hypothetical protein